MRHLSRGSGAALEARALLAAAIFIACPCAFPATLSIANQAANQGQTAVTPILFAAGGQTIAALQFDLESGSGACCTGCSWDYSRPGIQSPLSRDASARRPAMFDRGCQSERPSRRRHTRTVHHGRQRRVPRRCAGASNECRCRQRHGRSHNYSASLRHRPDSERRRLNVSRRERSKSAPAYLPAQSLPGEIVTLLDLFPASPTVLFNDAQAPVIYSGTGQANVIVPFGLDMSGPADVQIRSQNMTVGEQSIPVAQTAPAIFTQTGTGAGPAAALNQDSSANSFSDPAPSGSILTVYGTGFGITQPALLDGQIASGPAELVLPVTATIGGVTATVVYAGAAPTQIAGLTQINIQVPDGLLSDPNTPIALTIGSVTTPAGVTVSIR